jgi:hypothetical protein
MSKDPPLKPTVLFGQMPVTRRESRIGQPVLLSTTKPAPPLQKFVPSKAAFQPVSLTILQSSDPVRWFKNAAERAGMSSSVSGVKLSQPGLVKVPPPASHHARWRWIESGALSHLVAPQGPGWGEKQTVRALVASSTQSLGSANAERPVKARTSQQVARSKNPRYRLLRTVAPAFT